MLSDQRPVWTKDREGGSVENHLGRGSTGRLLDDLRPMEQQVLTMQVLWLRH